MFTVYLMLRLCTVLVIVRTVLHPHIIFNVWGVLTLLIVLGSCMFQLYTLRQETKNSKLIYANIMINVLVSYLYFNTILSYGHLTNYDTWIFGLTAFFALFAPLFLLVAKDVEEASLKQ